MTVQGLNVADFVSVGVDISPVSIPYSNIGIPVIAGDSPVIDTNTRVRVYTSLTEIANDFGTTAPEYLAAVPYYDQEPQPQTLLVGRWASGPTNGQLQGAILTPSQQLLSNFTGITAGAAFVMVDGLGYSITGVNFSSALNLNGVAALIQTALVAAGATGATVHWNAVNSQFIVTSGTTGANSSVGFFAPPTPNGKITSVSNPIAAATVTVGGTVVTFVTATPTGNQVQIGTTNLVTTQSLVTFLNASTDPNIAKCNYVLGPAGLNINVISKTTGPANNTFTLASSSGAYTVSGATLSGGTGVDISAVTGLSSAAGAAPPILGVAAETLLQCCIALANASAEWYDFTYAATAIPSMADLINVANYILGSTRLRTFAISTQDTGVINAAITTDIASVMQSLNNQRVFINYSSTNPYSVLSLCGRIGTVNYDGLQTAITLAWKQAPGIIAEVLTENQFQTMLSKGANAIVSVTNGARMIWPGQMCNAFWVDEVFGLDWQANRVQTDLFNFMYATNQTKVPQTDAGDNELATVIENSLIQGVRNGLLAPGQWNAGPIGSLQPGDWLHNGFYVFYPLIATQSQTDRDARISVLFQSALKLAGAVHQVNALLSVNR